MSEICYNPDLLVHTGWDIGVGDHTAITFFQVLEGGIPLIVNFFEDTGRGLDYYIEDILPGMGYNYGRYIWPHDARVREWGRKAMRRSESAWVDYGISVDIVERLTTMEYINIGRRFLNMCYFLGENTNVLLGHLQLYREEYNRKSDVYLGIPHHGPESHGCMSFIYSGCGFFDPDIDFSSNPMSLLDRCLV